MFIMYHILQGKMPVEVYARTETISYTQIASRMKLHLVFI